MSDRAKQLLEAAAAIEVGSVRVQRVGDDFDFVITNTETNESVTFSSDDGFELRDIIDQMASDD